MIKQFNRTRKINIEIKEDKLGKLLKGMSLLVKPFPDIVDKCFKFFKPENRLVRLEIPSLYDFEKMPTDKPYFYVHYDKAYLHYID